MSKHTPGPWYLNKYGEPVDVNGQVIRAKGLALTNTDEAKANSCLIAAAPELLEALRFLRNETSGKARPSYLIRAHALADAAIAKAEGRS